MCVPPQEIYKTAYSDADGVMFEQQLVGKWKAVPCDGR